MGETCRVAPLWIIVSHFGRRKLGTIWSLPAAVATCPDLNSRRLDAKKKKKKEEEKKKKAGAERAWDRGFKSPIGLF